MNGSLFKTMFKLQSKDIFSFAIGAVLYQWLIIWMYPSIANSKINDVIKTMPPSMLKAIGMESGFQSLGEFLAGEFYGLLYLIIMMIFTIMSAIRLISRLVDRGSMAYLLSTPVSRVSIAITQMSVLILGQLMIVFLTTIGGLVGVEVLTDNVKLDSSTFISMNLVGFLLFAVIGGYSFLLSCLLNDEKKALGLAAGMTLLFYVLSLLSKMTDKVEWVKYLTIFTLFNPQAIISGKDDIWVMSFGMVSAAILLFLFSAVIFKKRDLPL